MAMLQGIQPTQSEFVTLEGQRWVSVRQQRTMEAAEEGGDSTALHVDLRLEFQGRPIVFDGLESTSYIGAARGIVVFAICINDDVPGWLGEIFGVDAELAQEQAEMPAAEEAVYLLAPFVPGAACTFRLVMWTGSPAVWNPEVTWALTEEELEPLLRLAQL